MMLDIILSVLLIPLLVNDVCGQTDSSNSSSVFPQLPNAVHYPIYVPHSSPYGSSNTVPNGMTNAMPPMMPPMMSPMMSPLAAMAAMNPYDSLSMASSSPWMSPLTSNGFDDYSNPFLEVYDEQQLLQQKELLEKKKQLHKERDELRKDVDDTRSRIHSSIPAAQSSPSYDHRDPNQEDHPSIPSPLSSTNSGRERMVSDFPTSSQYAYSGSKRLSRRKPYSENIPASSEYQSASFPTTRGDFLRLRGRGSRIHARLSQSERDKESLSGVKSAGNIISNHRYFSRVNA